MIIETPYLEEKRVLKKGKREREKKKARGALAGGKKTLSLFSLFSP